MDEIGLWWPKEFFAQPGSQRIVLEPRAGGRLYEESDDGAQLLWSTVVLIAPPRTLELAGHLVPSFGGPATDMIRLTLEASPRGTTLRLSEVLFGRVSDATTAHPADRASMSDQERTNGRVR